MAEIKPALTDEEWRERRGEIKEVLARQGWYERSMHEPADAHRCAALCLVDQPFGFTWEMVDALGEALSSSECDVDTGRLADQAVQCVAALLPPRRP